MTCKKMEYGGKHIGPYDTVVTDEEEIPCGKSITTAFYLDGALVRQDVTIVVDRDKCGFKFAGATGL